jgi:hypothetical protein
MQVQTYIEEPLCLYIVRISGFRKLAQYMTDSVEQSTETNYLSKSKSIRQKSYLSKSKKVLMKKLLFK